MDKKFFEDSAKMLGNALICEARLAELRSPHVAPLNAFVEMLRVEMGSDYQIPYFDPWDGGTDAEVLYLLEAPGAKAKSSGFISRNNPDGTAKNIFLTSQRSGLSRRQSVIWNIVPWYIGSTSRIRPATSDDIEAGIRPLSLLLDFLPRLRAIVLFGRKAQRALPQIAKLRPKVKIFESPHPSPLFVNNSPGNEEKIFLVLRDVADYLDMHAK